MSVPDPDELMDAHIEEPLEEHEYDINNANANEMDDEFAASNASPLMVVSHDENAMANEQRLVSPQIVNSAPFELEYFTSNYTGYALMNRLLFVADNCPPMRKDALATLVNYVVENTLNVPMYVSAFTRLDKMKCAGMITSSSQDASSMSNGVQSQQSNAAATFPQCDSQWIETTNAKAQAKLEMLCADFKRQKDEGVKESTRRAMDNLFQQQVQMGHLHDAVKLYGRGLREYCTSSKHLIQMLLNWIEVLIHSSQWHRIEPLISQVERAICEAVESETASSSSTSSSTSRFGQYALNASQSAVRNMKQLINAANAKIAAVIALYRLNMNKYRIAAEKCLKVDLDCFDYPSLLSAKDIAIYGTFCALATFERSEVKEKVLGSSLFRKFLESEPKLVELLQKFCRSEFGTCFDIMEELRDSLLLDIYLSTHVNDIYYLIRRRAIVQYFTPYTAASISTMAEVFRVTIPELEDELVKLIESNDIEGRIDSHNKILYANKRDQRSATYSEVLDVGESLNERVNAITLRAALNEAQICVFHLDSAAMARRCPNVYGLGGHTMADDLASRADVSGCSSSSVSQQQGNVRNVFSRLFGSGRAGASQSAEPDSSNEVPTAKSITPEPPNLARDLSNAESAISVEQDMLAIDGITMDEQGSSSAEDHAPMVPGSHANLPLSTDEHSNNIEED